MGHALHDPRKVGPGQEVGILSWVSCLFSLYGSSWEKNQHGFQLASGTWQADSNVPSSSEACLPDPRFPGNSAPCQEGPKVLHRWMICLLRSLIPRTCFRASLFWVQNGMQGTGRLWGDLAESERLLDSASGSPVLRCEAWQVCSFVA